MSERDVDANETIDNVQGETADSAPICYKCLSDMESDGGNAWVCRECGHKVEIDDGQKRDKPVHDGQPLDTEKPMDAFDYFFSDVFSLRRVARDRTENAPKKEAVSAASILELAAEFDKFKAVLESEVAKDDNENAPKQGAGE